MVKITNKAVIFLKFPEKYPVPGEHIDFVDTRELDRELNENDVLTRNLYISVDPYLRNKMGVVASDKIKPLIIGQPIENLAIGEVIDSKNPKFPVGSIVVGLLNWEEHTLVLGGQSLRIIDGARESKIPLSSYLGVLGMPGLGAYGSFVEIGQPKTGETIFISSASGAVGGQIAKLKGLQVIGSAGSDEKVEYLLKDLHFDTAFNYKTGNILQSLQAAAPSGIDIYYDNVGGETLEAALEFIYGIKNLYQVILKSIKIQGVFIDGFSDEVKGRFVKEVSTWLLNGDIIYKEDVTLGLENAPEALARLFQGKNFGKAVVKVADL